MNTNQPTAPAMRAAKELTERVLLEGSGQVLRDYGSGKSTLEHAKSEYHRRIAEVIDRETGLPELLEACKAACRAAADCLPISSESDVDALYYKAKLMAIDEAASQCSKAILKAEQK